jgi:hypothetical protein
MVKLDSVTTNYGRNAKDRRDDARGTGLAGARAALETFYCAFHRKSLDLLADVFAPDEHCTVFSPLGGTARGRHAILAVYEALFRGPDAVRIDLSDVIEYSGPDDLLFVGREEGEFVHGPISMPLSIRTSRLFHYFGAEYGWRQIHHHGSIDDATQLAAYQRAVPDSEPLGHRSPR